MLKKYVFRPGINKEGTNYSAEGGWWSMDHMRFRSGFPEKIGGWAKYTNEPYLGSNRLLFNWVDLDGDDLMFLGTNVKAYIERGQAIVDITPVVHKEITPESDNCIQTTNTSTTVRVNFTAHGANVGDYIRISGVVGTVGGIPASEINGEFVVTATPSANYFYIEVETAASSSTTGGGTAIVVEILLPVGLEIEVAGTGWGAGSWSRGAWGSGTSIAVQTNQNIRLWSVDNFGENLIMNPRGLGLYIWKPANGYSVTNPAVNISTEAGASDVPTGCLTVLTTDDRHVVAFGVNPLGESEIDTLLIRWCDQEDYANWTPAVTNTAGDLRIPLGSYVVTAKQTRQEILVWTDTSLHSMKFVGAPYTFNLETLGDNTSIIGPNTAITVNNVTYWMGKDKFYAYSGRIETLPCQLRRYVFSNINFNQSDQFTVGLNEQFNEITWFYCSQNSNYIDRYVVYNYLENIWYYGTMNRTAWLDSHTRGKPFATAGGYMYQQETGYDNGDTNPPTALDAYIESCLFDIDDGQVFSFVQRFIPDMSFQNSTVSNPSATVTLTTRNFPGSTTLQTKTNTVTQTGGTDLDEVYTPQVWTRLRGRHMSIRISSTDIGVQWQVGSFRLDLRTDGRR